MQQLIQRLTSWAGGPLGLAAVIAAQLVLVLVFVFDPRIALAMVLGLLVVVVVLERPVLGVATLIGARLLSTGSLVFLRIGRIGVGPFEPALLLCLGSLVVYAALHGRQLWHKWPWRTPYLAIAGWVMVSLVWSVDRGDGISELLPMVLVFANAVVIITFVRSWDDFRFILWAWVGACVMIGVLAIMTDALGIQTTSVTFKAAEGGGRETGLGQQPNWFAMNLMFIIHTAFGMALIEKRRVWRVGLVLAGFFILVMMLKSGSRGGAYATLIGGGLAALAHPLFRRWFVRVGAVTATVFGVGIAFNFGDSAKALTRIASNVSLNQNYRQLNWETCVRMFWDTDGLGIGAGGYTTLLPQYNNYVAQSLYDYPHGIFWQIVAHYGLIGLALFAWLMVMVYRMARDIVQGAKGTEAEIYAWTMPAAMLGYVAWSFVEFTINDKPFWEFLSLYTALWFIVRRRQAGELSIPEWVPQQHLPGAPTDAP